METNLEQLEIDDVTSPDPFKGDDRYTVYFVLKVGGLALLFSLLWMLLFPLQAPSYNDHTNTKDTPGKAIVWEEDNSLSTEEIDTYITETVEELIIPQHNAAPRLPNAKQRYEQICTKYTTICKKTTREGRFNDNETLTYQAIIIHLIGTINKLLDIHIEQPMDYIKIYKDSNPNNRRGSATDRYIKMNTALIDFPTEFWQVLTHESGHMVDFSIIQGTSPRKDDIYTEFGRPRRSVDDPSIDFYAISWLDESTRKSSATYRNFVSGYGMRGMYEDFAEAHNLRLNHNDYFKKLASTNTDIQRKYTFFKNLYENQTYLNIGNNYPSTNERVWDTTSKLGE